MFAIFVRLLIIILAVVIQFSILSIGSYVLQPPNILLVLALAWTMILGFTRASGWLVAQGIITDLFLFQPVGYSVIMYIFIGYAVSFLSRRYLVEHKIWANVTLGGFMVFSFVLHAFMSQILLERSFLDLLAIIDSSFVREILFVLVIDVVLFWMVYKILGSMERYLSFYERKIQPKNYAQ